jgi:hypothetical protein
MSWVFDHSNATLGARLVALSIANHADKNGREARASVATYADEAHLSERQARRCVAELVELGEIRRAGKHGRRADRLVNVYEFPALADGVTGRQVDERTDRQVASEHGVTSTTPRGDIHDRHGVTPVSGEPSLEPSSEPSEDLGGTAEDRAAPVTIHLGAGPPTKPSKALSRGRPRDLIFEALYALWLGRPYPVGGQDQLTLRARDNLGRCSAQLRDAGATPELVARLAEAWLAVFPGRRPPTWTPAAAVEHWPALVAWLERGYVARGAEPAALEAANDDAVIASVRDRIAGAAS